MIMSSTTWQKDTVMPIASTADTWIIMPSSQPEDRIEMNVTPCAMTPDKVSDKSLLCKDRKQIIRQ